MAQWNMLYDMYERRLKAELSDAAVPAHIGVILAVTAAGRSPWARPPHRGTALAPGRSASSSSGPMTRVCRS